LAATLNAANGLISPSVTRAGDVIYWTGSAWATLAGNNSGTNFLAENASGVPSWNAGSTGVASLAYSCPPTTAQTGAVTLPNGIQTIAEPSAFAPTPAQCGSWFDVTGVTTATLPTIGVAGGNVTNPYFVTIKNANTSAQAVSVVTSGGVNINYNGTASGSINLTSGQSVGLAVNAGATGWSATGTVTGGFTPLHPGYNSGSWYQALYPGATTATGVVHVASSVYCTAFYIPAPVTIKSLGVSISTLSGGGNLGLALFFAVNGYPTTLIDYVPPISTASAVPVSGSLHNTTDSLASGFYYVCESVDNATEINSGILATSVQGNNWVPGMTLAGSLGGNPGFTALSCTAASTCGTGYAAWSAGAFTWASFTTATWTSVSTAVAPNVVMQVN
jgi:hypothetical protein